MSRMLRGFVAGRREGREWGPARASACIPMLYFKFLVSIKGAAGDAVADVVLHLVLCPILGVGIAAWSTRARWTR